MLLTAHKLKLYLLLFNYYIHINMKKVALINPWRYQVQEPRWLVAIHNDICDISRPKIFDASLTGQSPVSLLRHLVKHQYDVVWISLFDFTDNKWTRDFMTLLNKFHRNIISVFWWFWPTFVPDKFAKLNPDFIVRWHWEWIFRKLIEDKFNPKVFELIWSTIVVNNNLPLDLDNSNHTRPYDMHQYKLMARVDSNRWCNANCSFCNPTILGNWSRVALKSPEKVLEEIQYVMSKTSQNQAIVLWWGNFLNSPRHADEIYRRMNENWIKWRMIHTTWRLDQMKYFVRNPDQLRELSNWNKVWIEIWIETINSDVLKRVSKIPKDKEVELHFQFQDILDTVAAFPNTWFALDIIPFTPWTTTDILLQDFKFYEYLLENYQNISFWWSSQFLNKLNVRDSNMQNL